MSSIARALATLLAVAAAVAAWSVATAGAASSSFRNPVVPVTASGDDTPDPWIFRHAGRYWLTSTTPGRIEVRSAGTLAGLASAPPRRLWPRTGRAEPPERCCQVWAPEIHRLRGPGGRRWYVYFAANAGEVDEHRMYVLESARDDPAGPYRFKARLHVPQPYAIDATVATVGGRTYVIYSGGSSFAPASLFLAPLSDPWTVGGPPVEISRPRLPWEIVPFAINEGPEVLARGRRLHVVFSASWCGTGAYALGRLTAPRAADLLDPAVWRDAKHPAPLFAKAPARGVFGPGHGSFFTSPDGRESWMVYHATDDDRGCFTGGVRTTRAQRFRWRGDGTPDFGTPVSLRGDIAAPGGDGTLAVQAESALRRGRLRGRAAAVDDRRLVGYRGVVVRPARRGGAWAVLRIRVPRAGRYAAHLRVLGGPAARAITVVRPDGRAVTRSARRVGVGAVEVHAGVLALAKGTAVLRLRSRRAVTLDQVRLEPRRPARAGGASA
jgi:GH43 family beta-xylosidase